MWLWHNFCMSFIPTKDRQLSTVDNGLDRRRTTVGSDDQPTCRYRQTTGDNGPYNWQKNTVGPNYQPSVPSVPTLDNGTQQRPRADQWSVPTLVPTVNCWTVDRKNVNIFKLAHSVRSHIGALMVTNKETVNSYIVTNICPDKIYRERV